MATGVDLAADDDRFGISTWLANNFIIDTRQEIGLILPKPVIREMARQHDAFSGLMGNTTGEKMFDNLLQKAVLSTLQSPPKLKINTMSNYGIEEDRGRSTKYRKVRCTRHIFPIENKHIETDTASAYSKIISKSECALNNFNQKQAADTSCDSESASSPDNFYDLCHICNSTAPGGMRGQTCACESMLIFMK